MSLATLLRKKSIAQIQADARAGLSDAESPHALHRNLGVIDVTGFGIAAIIGAGIFSMVGNAAYSGGPAVVFLFVFTAIACAFSALCYAEFVSHVPVAGSAYTYAYASFGELLAWIIGWDLLMEYAIGNIAVAISWSDYFTGLLAGYGLHVPSFLTMDFLTASRGHDAISALLAQHGTLEAVKALPDVSGSALDAYAAWQGAPRIAGLPIVCDLPALFIVFVITALVYVGIRESKRASNFMVALKLAVIFLVIVLGAFYVNPANWSPFAPNGASGVMKGVSAVFFAYIGFDAISTTAEECKNPERDLPRGMIYSLVICTLLYVLLSLVLTGMVSYTKLQVGDPLAFVFGPEGVNLPWVSGIIAVSAVIAISTVLLVFQLGQPRIWMAMSRDGLLPPVFARIHPRFKTPSFATVLTGFLVAVPSLFMNLTEVTDLTSIGTLFAFTLVAGGILVLDQEHPGTFRRFVPYVSARLWGPLILLGMGALVLALNGEAVRAFFSLDGGWDSLKHKIPLMVWLVFAAGLAFLSFTRKLSLIPLLGVLCCSYLMTELGWTNWFRFGLWLIAGLIIYFSYGVKHSKLAVAS